MSAGRIIPIHSRHPTFVLDVSVAAVWLLVRRATRYTDDVFQRAWREAFVVPSSWFLDLAARIRTAERAGEVAAPRANSFLAAWSSFAVLVDDETEYRAWGDTLTIARNHSVPPGLAAYIELALREQLPLATTDPALTRAAATAGVPIFAP